MHSADLYWIWKDGRPYTGYRTDWPSISVCTPNIRELSDNKNVWGYDLHWVAHSGLSYSGYRTDYGKISVCTPEMYTYNHSSGLREFWGFVFTYMGYSTYGHGLNMSYGYSGY